MNFLIKLSTFALLSLILFIGSKYSYSANSSCMPADFRNGLQPNRDQGKIFWCYAHASADLLSFHFKTPKISASDIALQFNNSILGRLYSLFTFNFDVEQQFGLSKVALNRALANGVCRYSDFPDDYILKKESKGLISTWEKIDYLDAMNIILKEYRPLLKKSHGNQTEAIFRVGSLNEEQTNSVLLSSLPNREIFDEFRNLSCGKKRILLDSYMDQYQVVSQLNPDTFKEDINTQLSLGFPVIIDYFEDILFSGTHNYRKSLKEIHTSLVVGRKWNKDKQQCELLVRQSYGPHCKGYCVDGKCDPYSNEFKCEGGNIWISENDLINSILQVTYLSRLPNFSM